MNVLWVLALGLVTPARAHGPVHARIEAASAQLATATDPAAALARRGALFQLDHDFESAVRDFEEARALKPDLDQIDVRLASALLLAGYPERARVRLDAELARHADDALARVLRARARVALGDREGAVADFTQALARLERPGPALYLERAAIIDDPGVRVAGLREGVARVGAVASLIEPVVDLEIEAGHPDDALLWIDLLPEALRTSPRWLARRGDVLAQAGRIDAASLAYRDALTALDRLPPSRRDTDAQRALRADTERALVQLPARWPGSWWLVAAGVGLAAGLLATAGRWLVRRLAPPGGSASTIRAWTSPP